MSMGSRFLVLFSSVLVGQAACESSSATADAAVTSDAKPAVDVGITADVTGGTDTLATEAGTGDVGAGDVGAGTDAPASTFTQVYTMVIAQRCMPCHTTATGIGVLMGHLDMTSRATALMNLVNVPASGTACTGKGMRVVPGMPDSSIMYLKISLDDPAPCGSKMPLGRDPLPKAEADMIEGWIVAGAKDN
jgi:hypothetical protein